MQRAAADERHAGARRVRARVDDGALDGQRRVGVEPGVSPTVNARPESTKAAVATSRSVA